MSARSTLLLEHHLKELKLPTSSGNTASWPPSAPRRRRSPGLPAASRRTGTHRPPPAHGAAPHPRRALPATKSLDTFDFLAIPSLNKPLVMQLARCEYIERRENVIAIGNSGTGKTHIVWDWAAWPPAKGECRWVSPPPRPWSTNSWRPGTTADCSTCSDNWPASICSSSTSWASCRCPPPARNCSSRSSANATSAAPSW